MSEGETLRDLLLRDFGVDLPIHGGSGKKAAPIVIDSPSLAVEQLMSAQAHWAAGQAPKPENRSGFKG